MISIANDSNPHRKLLVHINGQLQQGHWVDSAPNITLDTGDNLTITIQAVGNVSVINGSGERFVCVTGFACNTATRNDVANRYSQCTLRSPATVEDDGKTLTIFLNNTQLTELTITSKWKLLAHYGLLFNTWACLCLSDYYC